MKSPIVFSILLAFGSIAAAEVVKVTGVDCLAKNQLSRGSGIIFMLNSEQYVLSSDHVTSGQGDRCFSAQNEDAQKANLQLLSSDWETGLSLLKVKTPFAGIRTTLNDFESDSNESDVVSAGFPAASMKLLSHAAKIVMSRSDRTPFVSTENMIEIIGAQIEFGMSGGALLSATGNKIIGMISHQRLLLVPGSASQMESNQQANHGLVIPAAQISAWITKTLDGKNSLYTRTGENTVLGAGILFRENKKPLMLAGAKGGDGVGVGGEEEKQSGVSIQISVAALDQFNNNSKSIDSNHELSWIRQVLPQLVKSGSLTVSAVLLLNPENESIEKHELKSTAQFISLLRTGNCIPLTNNTTAAAPELQHLQNELSAETSNAELAKLKIIIRSLIQIKNQYGLVRIPKNYLNHLQQHAGWKLFFEENFELAVKAKTFTLAL